MSRDEKQFSRQLEQALEASKKELSNNVSVGGESATETPTLETSTATEMSKDEEFVPDETAVSSESEEESYSAPDDDEDSDFMASPKPKKEKKRKTTKDDSKSTLKGKQLKRLVENSESVIKTNTKVSPRRDKKSTAKVKVTKVNAESERLISQTNTKTPSPSGIKELNLPISQTASSSPAALGVNKRTMNWTPPARIGEERTKANSAVKPSCAGVIRVGLSRNARVKSLHANIKT